MTTATAFPVLDRLAASLAAATSAEAAAVLIVRDQVVRRIAGDAISPDTHDALIEGIRQGPLTRSLGATTTSRVIDAPLPGHAAALCRNLPDTVLGDAVLVLLYREAGTVPAHAPGLIDHMVPVIAACLSAHQTLDAAEESAARLRAVLDAAVNAIIIIDGRGRIETFNHSAERLFGYRADEVKGQNVSMLMPSPHREQHDDYLASYLTTGEAKIIGVGRETEARRRDGSTFPVDLSVGEIDTNEEGRRFVGILRDISQFKMIESLLRQRQEELRQIFANAPLGIATTNLDGRFLRVNQALCTALGYDEDDLLSRHLADVVHPADRDEVAIGPDAIQDGRPGPPIRRRFLRRDGSTLHGILHQSVVLDDAGDPKLLVVQIEDHTLRLQAESEVRSHRDRLAHVSRLHTMGEMATGIAHEVNQPLTAVSAYAQALRRMVEAGLPADDPDVTETLDQIAAEARRAGDIIHRMRNMVRKRESRREECDLNDIVRDVMELAELDARQHDVALDAELAPGLPPVSVDAIQIQQVILNLLRNGAEATDPVEDRRGRVILRTLPGTVTGTVEVRVVDNGVGLPAGSEQSVFHQFVTTKESGMGMGLSISRTIITAHEGEMWVSRNPDHGATFHFTLPTKESG